MVVLAGERGYSNAPLKESTSAHLMARPALAVWRKLVGSTQTSASFSSYCMLITQFGNAGREECTIMLLANKVRTGEASYPAATGCRPSGRAGQARVLSCPQCISRIGPALQRKAHSYYSITERGADNPDLSRRALLLTLL